MPHIDSITKLIVPFRAPEIHKDIINFSQEEYFYYDQEWSVKKRFNVLDNFVITFYSWVNLNLPKYNVYPVNGSTEAIILAMQKLTKKNKKIALLNKEYSYYHYLALTYNIEIRWVNAIDDLDNDCVFVTSLPFCRDGLVHDLQKELLEKCSKNNIECWIDCAYYGASKPINIDIPDCVTNIFFSFSKNFGLALNRIGVWLSKDIVYEKSILIDYAYFPVGNLSLVTFLMKKYNYKFLWENYRTTQLQCTKNPTDIIFLSKDGCITDKMMAITATKYNSL